MVRFSSMVPPSWDVDLPDLLGFDVLSGVEVPATYGTNYAASFVECGLIELATFLAREEGR